MDQLASLIPIILLVLVNLAIIFRKVGRLTIPAWTAFLGSAIVLIILNNNEYSHAITVIANEADVFIFLLGMFVIVTAMDMSGVLEERAREVLSRARSGKRKLLWINIGFGFAAAILLNDTVAITAPIILIIAAKQLQKDSKPFVLAVTFALTFGSALLPIGNPQNFILATHGNISFIEFALWSFIPVIIGLFGCYVYLTIYYRNEFTNEQYKEINFLREKHEYQQLAKPSLIAMAIMLIGLVLSSFVNISKAIVILVVVGIFLFFVNERNDILARIDWGILFFFAGMFVLIDAVTSTDIVKALLNQFLSNAKPDFPTFILFILVIFIASQVISNVPVAIIVAQILPLTNLNYPIFWIGAALSSTFAGATTVLGAASNIIVLETAGRKGVRISWFEFIKIGVPISLFSLLGIIFIGFVYFTFFPV